MGYLMQKDLANSQYSSLQKASKSSSLKPDKMLCDMLLDRQRSLAANAKMSTASPTTLRTLLE
jgi:hypothetical protein